VEGYNKAIVEGVVCKAYPSPERLVLQVEVTISYYDFKAKERKEQKDLVWCVVMGRSGEFFGNVARQGAFIGIEGRLTVQEVTIEGKPYRLTVVEAQHEGSRLMVHAPSNRHASNGNNF
jgi:single-stranded DNA-binding protein